MTNAPAGDKPLVLVVDDYQDAREMYAEYLEFSGFRVAEAVNGAEALDKAFSLLPDIILMDLSLPVIDGWEATRRIKADGRLKHTPVIALTAHAMPGDEARAVGSGCDDYLIKPLDENALLEKVRTWLEWADWLWVWKWFTSR